MLDDNEIVHSDTMEKNSKAYHHYRQQLIGMHVANINWSGLPLEINPVSLSRLLVNKHLVVFFRDEATGRFFISGATPSGGYNMSGDPISYTIVNPGQEKSDLRIGSPVLTRHECVPIWLNVLRKSEMPEINEFALQLALARRTGEVNLRNQNHPVFLRAPFHLQKDVKNIAASYYANEPAIMVDKDLSLEDMFYLAPSVPFIADKVSIEKQKLWTEAMTFLGIDSTNTEKRERLLEAEVTSNEGQIVVMRKYRLDSLQYACKQINMKYGLEVGVSFGTGREEGNKWDGTESGSAI
jgi:hypothetical protein